LGILLYGSIHNLINTPVMAQVNHLAARALYDSTHNVYRGIMSVKQAGSGNDSDFIFRLVRLLNFHLYSSFSVAKIG
jgi:hypothetical protein